MPPHDAPTPNTVADALGMARLAQDIESFRQEIHKGGSFPWQTVCFAAVAALFALGIWVYKEQASTIKDLQKIQEQRTLQIAVLEYEIKANTKRIDELQQLVIDRTDRITKRILAINERVDRLPGMKREELP